MPPRPLYVDEIKIDIYLASGPFEKNVILEAMKTHPNIFEVDIGSRYSYQTKNWLG